MATCASCGNEIHDDDWTCGQCGAPVIEAAAAGGAGTRSSGYASSYESQPAAYGSPAAYHAAPAAYGAPATPLAKGGLSRTTRTIIIVAAVAIVAIIAVWFFVVRGAAATSGDEFLGTWNATGSGIGSVVVARPGDDFEVTLTGEQPEKKVTVPAHIDGSELVITVDDFATMAGEANADRFKDTLKALAGDFRIVFASVDPKRLQMRIEGTDNAGDAAKNTTTLTKATP